MFVHVIQSNCWLYFILVFFPYRSRAWVTPKLRHFYLCVCMNMFANVIFMVNAICLCTSYDMLLGCTKYWESCHAYLLHIIRCSIASTIVDLNSQ